MLTDKELKMYRHELDHNFPMFSEWEKEKLMDIAEHGTGGLVRVLTYLAEARLKQEQAEQDYISSLIAITNQVPKERKKEVLTAGLRLVTLQEEQLEAVQAFAETLLSNKCREKGDSHADC